VNSCLNCRFEPTWPPFSKGEYSVSYGTCKFEITKVDLPACVSNHISLKKRSIARYDDDSGVYSNCAVWAPKE